MRRQLQGRCSQEGRRFSGLVLLYKRSSGQFVCSCEPSSGEGETSAEEGEDAGLSEVCEQTEGLGSGAG